MANTPPNTLVELSIDDVHPHSMQPRLDMDTAQLRDLAGSIASLGLLAPIRVTKRGGRYEVIDGHRRLHVLRAMRSERVPVVIEERDIDAGDVTAQALALNTARSSLSPIEKAEAIQRLMTTSGRTANAIARQIGLSEASISKLVALLVLPEEEKRRVHTGELGLVAGYRMATGKAKGTPQIKPVPAPLPERRKPVRLVVSQGVTLTFKRSVCGLDVLADALTALVGRLRDAHGRGVNSVEFLSSIPK